MIKYFMRRNKFFLKRYYFHVKDPGNNEIIVQSEGYNTRRAMYAGASQLREILASPDFREVDETAPEKKVLHHHPA